MRAGKNRLWRPFTYDAPVAWRPYRKMRYARKILATPLYPSWYNISLTEFCAGDLYVLTTPSNFLVVIKQSLSKTFGVINTRTGGGGGQKCPPLRFFADSGKTAARSADIFSVPAENWITHLVSKFQPQVTKGQVTRSGQSQKRVSDFEAAQWPH